MYTMSILEEYPVNPQHIMFVPVRNASLLWLKVTKRECP